MKLRIGAFFFVTMITAASQISASPHVFENDRGGPLAERMREIETFRLDGESIEIRGRVCYSTCTLFLGLPQTCIDPSTTFGFHGPSRNGRRLDAAKFEFFSRVMAEYYPQPLADWFLSKGRHKISGVHKVSGAHLIRQGIARACA